MSDQSLSEYQLQLLDSDLRNAILSILDGLAEEGSYPTGGCRICYTMDSMLCSQGFGRFDAYAFVSHHSKYYKAFYHLDQSGWGEPGSESDLTRRAWCAKLAASLRANPGLWMKEEY